MNKVSNAIKINFDVTYNPEEPTLILAKKNGDKLGKINAKAIEVSDNMSDASEITFNVHKEIDGEKDSLWDLITNFKLVYCVEWNCWFECTVEIDESNETVKTVFCTRLGQAELSQIMLYNIEINTEADIERDDYVIPTVLYRENGVLGEGITESDVKFYNEVKKEDMKLPFEGYEEASLLHRILKDKAPHYSVGHVDTNLRYMQREFTFDGISIYDACQEIAEELNCLFVFDSCSDENGGIQRTISVYDLESRCLNPDCGYRGEFSDVCPECKGIGKDKDGNEIIYSIDDGYGEDTTIFVTADEIADDIQLTTDTDAMKNCFKLEAGDDLMTATIRNCNPNGSDYIWYLSNEMKADMSDKLVSAIEAYDILYKDYQSDFIQLDEALVKKYNDLVDKYNNFMKIDDDDKFEKIENPVKGFPALIDAYYNMFDMYLYLESGLMPTVNTARPIVEEEINKLTTDNLSPVAVNVTSTSSNPLKATSVSTADNIVLSMAKTIVDSRYKVKIEDGSTLSDYVEGSSERVWTGKITLTAYSDDEITGTTDSIQIIVNDDYETFVKNKLDKSLSADDTEDLSVSSLFEKELAANFVTSNGDLFKDSDGNNFMIGAKTEESFQYALKEYSLKRLESFHDACQSCIELLVEQGVSNRETWGDKRICIHCSENEELSTKIVSACPNCGYDKEFILNCPECDYIGDSVNTCENCGSSDIDYTLDLYTMLYADYAKKLSAIQEEMNIRSNEMSIISGVYDADGNVVEDGLQTVIEKIKAEIQGELDFEKFLGEKLWLEFCSFRREDKYSNDNYISEGKNNAEIITLANEFIETAKKEIYKSAELQCSISASLKNLLVIEKFKPLVNNFRVGNWLRVMVDDRVYKLRLISYTIDYDSLDSISVEFSDVVRSNSSIKSVKDVLAQASSIATSYPAVQRQAKQGEESNAVVSSWFDSGLDATNVKIVGGADGQCQTWDNHGMLFREYDDATGDYSPEQMKIINSTMAITTDNWKTTKTAVGKYYYVDPETGEMRMAYGVNGETIIGKFILGENLSIQNESGNMKFDGGGLSITSGSGSNIGTMMFNENGFRVEHGEDNYVRIDPSTSEIMNIVYSGEEVFEVNEKGLTINGNIMARSLELGTGVEIDSGVITNLHPIATSGSYNQLDDKPDFHSVATSGNYNELNNKPNLFSGNYNDLTNKPTLFSGSYDELSDKPSLATVATSGRYTDLTGSINNAGKLLYIDNDGSVTTITIESLKNLLGLT